MTESFLRRTVLTGVSRFAHQCGLLHDDEGGVVAIVFGLTVIPMIALLGGANDYGRALFVKSGLQGSLDAGLLSAVNAGGKDVEAITIAVSEYVKDQAAQFTDYPVRVTDVQVVGESVSATAKVDVPTAFLPLIGLDALNVTVESEVTWSVTGVEIALVLDNTGSMASGNKIGAMRDAAKLLVETVYDNRPEFVDLRTALVPFVTAVNVKSSGFDMSWMDTRGLSRLHGRNFESDGGGEVNHFDLFDDLGATWSGCVEARPEPYDISDAPPDPSKPDTLWVPYLWPDEPDLKAPNGSKISYPDRSDYGNDYLKDRFGTSRDAELRLKDTAKYAENYDSKNAAKYQYSGPNQSCPDPITPLTSKEDLVQERISDMEARPMSGTNIAQGLAWGWRVLSPGAPFTEGKAFGSNDARKIMILLTDGENQVWGNWNHHMKSHYTSYGYLNGPDRDERLVHTNRHKAAGVVDTKVAAMCESIKALDVRLYTITFRLNSSSLRSLFRDCASEPNMYFDSPSNDQLKRDFKKIAEDIYELHLSR